MHKKKIIVKNAKNSTVRKHKIRQKRISNATNLKKCQKIEVKTAKENKRKTDEDSENR